MNSEFSEYSNQMLFKILDKNAELFVLQFELPLFASHPKQANIVLRELAHPVTEINYQNIYDKIKSVDALHFIKSKLLSAIASGAQDKE